MGVTLVQIAKVLGISQPTVSRILGGHTACYRRQTVEAVLQAAERLGYRPNAYARAMRANRFGAAALLQDRLGVGSDFLAVLATGLHDALEHRGMRMIYAPFFSERLAAERALPRILGELMVDGLLINYHFELPPCLDEQIRRHRIPSVYINRKMGHDAVYPDDVAASRQLTEHFLAMGRREIVYVDIAYHHRLTPQRHFSQEDRLEGYRQAMRAAGFQPRVVLDDSPVTPDQHPQIVIDLLTGPRPAEVLIGQQRGIAGRAMHVAPVVGRTLGEDFHIGAFSHDVFGPGCIIAPPDWRSLAQDAVAMLEAKLAQPDAVVPSRVVGPRMRSHGGR